MGGPQERHVQSLKWRETMFENTASEFDNRPLSSGPLFQWLGVQWQGTNYAVSLNSISAVFKTSPSPVSNSIDTQLDVAVHDGAVVFIPDSVDILLFQQLGNRKDGAVNSSSL